MAKVGLKGFWIGEFAETSSGITYTKGKKVAKAVTLNESMTIANQKLYADNALDDEVNNLTGMTINVTPNGFDAEVKETLLGQKKESVNINGEEKEVTVTKGNDEGVYIGVGIIQTERISGVEKYISKVYAKTKFRPSDSKDYNTRGENIEFATEAYVGTCYPTEGGYYTFEDEHTSEDAAVKWLEDIFKIAAE